MQGGCVLGYTQNSVCWCVCVTGEREEKEREEERETDRQTEIMSFVESFPFFFLFITLSICHFLFLSSLTPFSFLLRHSEGTRHTCPNTHMGNRTPCSHRTLVLTHTCMCTQTCTCVNDGHTGSNWASLGPVLPPRHSGCAATESSWHLLSASCVPGSLLPPCAISFKPDEEVL